MNGLDSAAIRKRIRRSAQCGDTSSPFCRTAYFRGFAAGSGVRTTRITLACGPLLVPRTPRVCGIAARLSAPVLPGRPPSGAPARVGSTQGPPPVGSWLSLYVGIRRRIWGEIIFTPTLFSPVISATYIRVT